MAAATRTAVAASNSRKGHHRSPANGRAFWAHPIGENHETVPSPMSPTARSTNAAPSTAPAAPYTTRVFSVTWAARSATPPNKSPIRMNDTPNTNDPAAGEALGEQDNGCEYANGQAHGGHRKRRCNGGRVAPDRKGAHKFEAAGFLLAPREPADHEQAHEGHQHHAPGAELERYLPADGVQTLGGAVESDGCGVVLGGGSRLIKGSLGREQTLDARCGECRQRNDGDDPDQDPDAVAAHDEAGQLDASSEHGHHRGHGLALRLLSIRSGSFASSSR